MGIERAGECKVPFGLSFGGFDFVAEKDFVVFTAYAMFDIAAV